VHELEPKLIITTMHGQQHIKILFGYCNCIRFSYTNISNQSVCFETPDFTALQTPVLILRMQLEYNRTEHIRLQV